MAMSATPGTRVVPSRSYRLGDSGFEAFRMDRSVRPHSVMEYATIEHAMLGGVSDGVFRAVRRAIEGPLMRGAEWRRIEWPWSTQTMDRDGTPKAHAVIRRTTGHDPRTPLVRDLPTDRLFRTINRRLHGIVAFQLQVDSFVRMCMRRSWARPGQDTNELLKDPRER